jgi:GNAT superfamily N-acetyltransferase
MTMETRALRLQEAQVGEASEALARAFFDDPMTVYMMPDDNQRKEILPGFMAAGSRICLPHGEIYTTPGTILGSANWLPPGKTEVTEEALAASGALDVLGRMGEEAARRFGGLMAQLGELHHAAVSPDHWYLLILGVDPPRQGQGVGGALIEPILRRADAEGKACYLETMKPRNVTFYGNHGFEVVVEDDTADGGLHFWTMRRNPRT